MTMFPASLLRLLVEKNALLIEFQQKLRVRFSLSAIDIYYPEHRDLRANLYKNVVLYGICAGAKEQNEV